METLEERNWRPEARTDRWKEEPGERLTEEQVTADEAEVGVRMFLELHEPKKRCGYGTNTCAR